MATEKRLIDGNALIATLEKIAKEDRMDCFYLDEITQEIFDAPTVDAVEVVRCKDCKHFKDWGDGNKTCYLWTDQWDMPTVDDAFCSYGERRTDNG